MICRLSRGWEMIDDENEHDILRTIHENTRNEKEFWYGICDRVSYYEKIKPTPGLVCRDLRMLSTASY